MCVCVCVCVVMYINNMSCLDCVLIIIFTEFTYTVRVYNFVQLFHSVVGSHQVALCIINYLPGNYLYYIILFTLD